MVDGREERRQRKARAAEERAFSARGVTPAPTQGRPSAGTLLGSDLMGRLSAKLGTSYPHFTDKKLETQADVLTRSGPNPTQASRSPCRPSTTRFPQTSGGHSSLPTGSRLPPETAQSFMQIDPWWGRPIIILNTPEHP